MNHQRIYDNLIGKFQNKTIEGYTEEHHITPKCLGGTDDQNNLVRMTAKAHFIAHYLLIKIHPDHRGLWYAFRMMTNGCVSENHDRDYKIGSRLYELCKVNINRLGFSEETKLKMRNSKLGVILSEETKRKMSLAASREKKSKETKEKMKASQQLRHETYVISDETKEKIRASLTGHKMSEETKLKMSNSRTGRIFSEETRKKISLANTGKSHSEETRKKISNSKIGSSSPMKGKKFSEESKLKMSKAQAGRIMSDETKAKIKASIKAAWEIKKQKLMNIENPLTI